MNRLGSPMANIQGMPKIPPKQINILRYMERNDEFIIFGSGLEVPNSIPAKELIEFLKLNVEK